jgi:hypothetical protein
LAWLVVIGTLFFYKKRSGASRAVHPLSGQAVRSKNARYPNGRHSFTRATIVECTWADLPSRRLRFELFEDARCRRPGLRRRIFPVAVILKRFATDFFVFRRAIALGMGRAN